MCLHASGPAYLKTSGCSDAMGDRDLVLTNINVSVHDSSHLRLGAEARVGGAGPRRPLLFLSDVPPPVGMAPWV